MSKVDYVKVSGTSFGPVYLLPGDETVGYKMAYKCNKCQQYKTQRLL